MGKSVNPLFLWSFSIAFWCFLYVYQRRISASTPKFESRHWVTLRGTSKSKTLSAPSEGCLNKSESWHGYQMLWVAIPGTQIGGSYMYLPFFCLFFRAKFQGISDIPPIIMACNMVLTYLHQLDPGIPTDPMQRNDSWISLKQFASFLICACDTALN